MDIRSTGSADSGARGAGETGRRHEKGGSNDKLTLYHITSLRITV